MFITVALLRLPVEDKFNRALQVRRVSLSVKSNLAKGYFKKISSRKEALSEISTKRSGRN
jgi:hypothetical protein